MRKYCSGICKFTITFLAYGIQRIVRAFLIFSLGLTETYSGFVSRHRLAALDGDFADQRLLASAEQTERSATRLAFSQRTNMTTITDVENPARFVAGRLLAL